MLKSATDQQQLTTAAQGITADRNVYSELSGRDVIVASGAREITGTDFVRLSIDSILTKPDVKSLADYIYEYFEQNNLMSFTDSDELMNSMEAALQSLSKQQEQQQFSTNLITRAAGAISTARIRVQENKIAYKSSAYLLPNAIFWPNPEDTKRPTSIFETLPFARRHKLIDKSTPIGSAGSCFAMEIAISLKSRGFNYVVAEENDIASARWGIIFNAPSFRGLIEFAFGVKKRPFLSWIKKQKALFRKKLEYWDPFREDVIFETTDQMATDYSNHIVAAREALTKSKVFVITLGLNEVWYLTADNTPISRSPWNLSPHLVEKRVLTVEENVRELQRMLDIWRVHNPELKLIVTVSPVPLHATFRAESHHVISANNHSKSVLRVAAEEFCNRNEDVFYFPSFETVLYCTENPWDNDQRHVSRESVANVMRLFDEMFVID